MGNPSAESFIMYQIYKENRIKAGLNCYPNTKKYKNIYTKKQKKYCKQEENVI